MSFEVIYILFIIFSTGIEIAIDIVHIIKGKRDQHAKVSIIHPFIVPDAGIPVAVTHQAQEIMLHRQHLFACNHINQTYIAIHLRFNLHILTGIQFRIINPVSHFMQGLCFMIQPIRRFIIINLIPVVIGILLSEILIKFRLHHPLPFGIQNTRFTGFKISRNIVICLSLIIINLVHHLLGTGLQAGIAPDKYYPGNGSGKLVQAGLFLQPAPIDRCIGPHISLHRCLVLQFTITHFLFSLFQCSDHLLKGCFPFFGQCSLAAVAFL
ncbi:hypothetical protein D3C72_1267750 [compost metagenome]